MSKESISHEWWQNLDPYDRDKIRQYVASEEILTATEAGIGKQREVLKDFSCHFQTPEVTDILNRLEALQSRANLNCDHIDRLKDHVDSVDSDLYLHKQHPDDAHSFGPEDEIRISPKLAALEQRLGALEKQQEESERRRLDQLMRLETHLIRINKHESQIANIRTALNQGGQA